MVELMLTGLTEVPVIEAIGHTAPEQQITSIMAILFVESAKQNKTTQHNIFGVQYN
jgi:hypothetical protein